MAATNMLGALSEYYPCKLARSEAATNIAVGKKSRSKASSGRQMHWPYADATAPYDDLRVKPHISYEVVKVKLRSCCVLAQLLQPQRKCMLRWLPQSTVCKLADSTLLFCFYVLNRSRASYAQLLPRRPRSWHLVGARRLPQKLAQLTCIIVVFSKKKIMNIVLSSNINSPLEQFEVTSLIGINAPFLVI